WKPTGKNFKTIGLRWGPTGKIFTSSTTKVDSEPTNGSNEDITNQYEYLSTGTSFNPKKERLGVWSELRIHDHSNESFGSKLVPKVVPPADKTATSRQELELLFHHHITMLRVYMVSTVLHMEYYVTTIRLDGMWASCAKRWKVSTVRLMLKLFEVFYAAINIREEVLTVCIVR
ncbi:hypothetical protein Tco_1159590, partial [Tanacetum coccineum]